MGFFINASLTIDCCQREIFRWYILIPSEILLSTKTCTMPQNTDNKIVFDLWLLETFVLSWI